MSNIKHNDINVNHSHISRHFKGIWIPQEMWFLEGLTPSEKCLLAEIDSLYCTKHKGCYADNEYLAKFMGVKERTIRDALCKFRSLGLIQDISFDGRKRVIQAMPIPEDYARRLAEWRESATHQHGGISPPSMADSRHLSLYIDTNIDTNTPIVPKTEDVANAPSAGFSFNEKNTIMEKETQFAPNPPIAKKSQTQKNYEEVEHKVNYQSFKPDNQGLTNAILSNEQTDNPKKTKSSSLKKRKEATEEAKALFLKFIQIIKDFKPTYVVKGEHNILESLDEMLSDGRKEEEILRVLAWGVKDNVIRGDWNGWSSKIICKNPASYLCTKFEQIDTASKAKKDRKFAPCSDDTAAHEKLKGMRKI